MEICKDCESCCCLLEYLIYKAELIITKLQLNKLNVDVEKFDKEIEILKEEYVKIHGPSVNDNHGHE